MMSVAHTCIMPMQDVLGLGEDARMNTPGKESGNWTWRMTIDQFNSAPRERLADLARVYGRERNQQPEHSLTADT
jgi:4-alpha-glucanotransferase